MELIWSWLICCLPFNSFKKQVSYVTQYAVKDPEELRPNLDILTKKEESIAGTESAEIIWWGLGSQERKWKDLKSAHLPHAGREFHCNIAWQTIIKGCLGKMHAGLL